jgi:hypothetical protein
MRTDRTPVHMPVAIFLTVTVPSSFSILECVTDAHALHLQAFNCKFVKLDQMFILHNTCNYIYMQPFLLKLKINE